MHGSAVRCISHVGIVPRLRNGVSRRRRRREGTSATALDPRKQYVVVPDAKAYCTKVLGCAIGRPLFCSSPLDGGKVGQAPGTTVALTGFPSQSHNR